MLTNGGRGNVIDQTLDTARMAERALHERAGSAQTQVQARLDGAQAALAQVRKRIEAGPQAVKA